MSADDLLDDEGAARLLSVPRGTVRAWAARGVIPSYRLAPRVTRYSRRELLAWAETRRAPADELARRRGSR